MLTLRAMASNSSTVAQTTPHTMKVSAFGSTILLSLLCACEAFTVLQEGTWVNYMSGENFERPPISPESFYPKVYDDMDLEMEASGAVFLSQAYKNIQKTHGYAGRNPGAQSTSDQERMMELERSPIRPDEL